MRNSIFVTVSCTAGKPESPKTFVIQVDTALLYIGYGVDELMTIMDL